jgi:hypothetical protein
MAMTVVPYFATLAFATFSFAISKRVSKGWFV